MVSRRLRGRREALALKGVIPGPAPQSHPCQCGKRSYATREDAIKAAISAAGAKGKPHRVYLDHGVYHLTTQQRR